MEIGDLLDKAKTKANIGSDYALAKVLGIHTGTIANWRKEKSHPSNEEAVKLATLAGLDEMDVIAEIELRTAKTEKKREFWRHYIESRGITACLTMTALAMSIAMAPRNAEADILHFKNYSELNQPEIYIIRSTKQDWRMQYRNVRPECASQPRPCKNSLLKFLLVAKPTSSGEIPRRLAISCATNFTYAG